MTIVEATPAHIEPWSRMRAQLWPEDSTQSHARDIQATYLAGDPDRIALIGLDEDFGAKGFAEATVRHDYVEGCGTSPVAFVEGIFVAPEVRVRGLGRYLVLAVESWGRARGCRELASDALIDNQASHAFHEATGFEETLRVVYFRKLI